MLTRKFHADKRSTKNWIRAWKGSCKQKRSFLLENICTTIASVKMLAQLALQVHRYEEIRCRCAYQQDSFLEPQRQKSRWWCRRMKRKKFRDFTAHLLQGYNHLTTQGIMINNTYSPQLQKYRAFSQPRIFPSVDKFRYFFSFCY